ncbi:MAG: aspartate/glutamate racemase family protein [Leptolyngbyaceae cyanobacterium RM2_2_4]|nr:aspartate/glutamate racemase family protein [Leptolyngbyaceae cyanobacterium SM1_4_3]NJO49347.1 aspartate/glutamate racemase family protein [Leptolyngbyaceae cyanobacterium RM2_2_4]
MKTIGLIGGLSWESTVEYYRLLNESVKAKLGGLHSAKILLYSFDFAEIEALQHQGDWDQATELMIEAAQKLETGKADCVLICSNTMHKMADAVQANINIPLLHIADPTAKKIVARGFYKIGLLGTRFTMEQEFYKGRLTDKYGLEVVIPNQQDVELVHNIIYQELCLGKVESVSKNCYKQIIETLVSQGAEAIVLGCTEIMLLVQQADSAVPLFDTTAIHAEAAVDYAIQG